MTSVNHTNGDLITSATMPTLTGDWTVHCAVKCNIGEYGDAVNDHLIVGFGNTGGSSEGFGIGVLAASNTTLTIFNFRAGGAEIQQVAVRTGSSVVWVFCALRHTAGAASIDASFRLENQNSWTTTTLTLTAQVVAAGGTFVIGSDQFNEHAVDSDTRHCFTQNVRMSDAVLLTASQYINNAPAGTNVHWFRLLDAATAATSTGTAGNGTVTGTLLTANTEPNELRATQKPRAVLPGVFNRNVPPFWPPARETLLSKVSATASQALTLTAGSGSFAFTGQDAGLNKSLLIGQLPPSPPLFGEFNRHIPPFWPPARETLLSRQSAATNQVLTLAAAQGSFAFTGQAITLTRARALTAAQGAFAFTGEPVNLSKGKTLALAQGAFAFTGEAINLPKGKTLSAAQGAYALTGEAVALTRGRTLTAAQGAFIFTGEPALFPRARSLSAAQGSFAFTGEPVNLPRGKTLGAAQGAFAFTGQAVALPKGKTLGAGQGSFAFTGEPVAFKRARTLTAAQGSFAFTGEQVNLVWATAGHFVLIAGAGAFAFTGQLVALRRTSTLTATRGSFVFNGQAVGFPKGKTLGAGQGAYTFTGLSANLPRGRTLAAGPGAFAFTGQVANLVFTSAGHATLFAGTGFFGFAGQVAGLILRQAGNGGIASARMATQRASASLSRVVFVGTKFRASCTFQDFSKTLADPDAVTFSIGGVSNVAARDSVGAYHFDFTPTEAGRFHWRWAGTGAVSAATEGFIEVLPTEE